MKVIKIVSVTIGFLFLFGCVSATGSVIITGTVRDALEPDEVKIYLDPPSVDYETIGLIEASGEVNSSKQATQDRVIAELKNQAAKIGANAILLVSTGATSNESGGFGGFIGGGFSSNRGMLPLSLGISSGGPSQTLSAQARAIYVSEVVVEQEEAEE